MEFIVNKPYNFRGGEFNPNYYIGLRQDELLVFEMNDGKLVAYTKETADEVFTPAIQYPPCSLADAEVGDTVETWDGEKIKIEEINKGEKYAMRGDRTWRIDGVHCGEKDCIDNARFLHKAPKGIEPPTYFTIVENGEELCRYPDTVEGKLEAIRFLVGLTDRVVKLEGKQ